MNTSSNSHIQSPYMHTYSLIQYPEVTNSTPFAIDYEHVIINRCAGTRITIWLRHNILAWLMKNVVFAFSSKIPHRDSVRAPEACTSEQSRIPQKIKTNRTNNCYKHTFVRNNRFQDHEQF